MRPEDSGDAFRQALKAWLRGQGLVVAAGSELSGLTFADGLDRMLAVYREVAADEANGPDGDMLLYQWGTYDWSGTGATFSMDLTPPPAVSPTSAAGRLG